MERVIFRIEKCHWDTDVHYMAVFPDTPANAGRYACVSFYFGDDEKGDYAVFEPFCECDRWYYLKTKRIPKNTELSARCLKAIEAKYGESFKVMEKITGR